MKMKYKSTSNKQAVGRMGAAMNELIRRVERKREEKLRKLGKNKNTWRVTEMDFEFWLYIFLFSHYSASSKRSNENNET